MTIAFPDVTRGPSKFFAALAEADQRVDEHAELAWKASCAPPVTTFGSCPCGSVFEARESRVEVTEQERAAAAEAVADFFGRAPFDGVDAALVDRIIDVINRQRETEAYEALQDWRELHDYCGGVS